MSTVAVVGLGYVGLPLAVAFGKKCPTIGFDLSAEKVENYRRHVDPTGEVSGEELRAATRLTVTTDPAQLSAADIVKQGLTIAGDVCIYTNQHHVIETLDRTA